MGGMPACAQVERRENERDDNQDVGQRGSLTEVELHERQVVGLGRDRLRRVRRAAAGEAEDDVDHLERVHHAEHEHDVDRRPQQRPGDVAECLPAGCAVQRRGLIEIPRDVLQPAVEDGDVERDPDPDVHQDHGNESQRRAGQPARVIRHQIQGAQHLVDRAVVPIEKPAPNGAGHDQRNEPRQQQQRAQCAAKREPSSEVERDNQPDRELSGDRPDGEQHRVDDRLAEHGRVDHRAVVVQPHPRRDTGEECCARVVLKCHDDVLHDGIAEEQQQVGHGGREKQQLNRPLASRGPAAGACSGDGDRPHHGAGRAWASHSGPARGPRRAWPGRSARPARRCRSSWPLSATPGLVGRCGRGRSRRAR